MKEKDVKGFSISIVIPVFNAQEFVAEAVRSALAQPEVAVILLVEDGSPDNALSICLDLALQDPRIRILRHRMMKTPIPVPVDTWV